MKILLDLALMINVLGFGQGLILSLVLLRSKYSKLANRLLAFLLIALSVIIFNTITTLAGYRQSLRWYDELSNAFILVIAPSLYWFVRIKADYVPRQNQLFRHYLPFFIYFVYNISFIVSNQFGYILPLKPPIDILAFITFNVQFIVYFYLIIRFLRAQRKEKKLFFWVKITLFIVIIPWLISLGFILYEIYVQPIPNVFKMNVSLLFALHTSVMGYIHLVNPTIFEEVEKYKSSGLNKQQSSQYMLEIEQVLSEQQLFLDSGLTLDVLVDKTSIPRRYISQVINEQLEINFIDYINRFRIEECKKRLSDPAYKNLTVVGIAKDCGFKSSSAFYVAFKKNTGLTPRQYQQNLNK